MKSPKNKGIRTESANPAQSIAHLLKGYGKSEIYLEPFADTVADTVYRLSSSDSRNSIACGDNGNHNANSQLTAEGLLTSLLVERLRQVEQDPSLKQKDRWTTILKR